MLRKVREGIERPNLSVVLSNNAAALTKHMKLMSSKDSAFALEETADGLIENMMPDFSVHSRQRIIKEHEVAIGIYGS